MSEYSAASGSGMVLKTHFRAYEFTFKWIIEGFSKLQKGWTEKSPEFSIEPGSTYHIEFEHCGNFVTLYLCREHDTNFKINCELTISDCNAKVLYRECTSGHYSKKSPLDNNISTVMATLRNSPKDEILFAVTIKFERNVPITMKVDNCSIPSEMRLGQLEKLSREMKNVLDNSLKTDLTLVVQGACISCHKVILAGRSPIFARMFQKGMTEEDTSTVHVDDISVAAVRALLYFIYSAKVVDYDFDAALEVYAAADKYEVLDLKDACGLILVSKVTVETATKVLYFADMHRDPVLKHKILQFINLHHKPIKEEQTMTS